MWDRLLACVTICTMLLAPISGLQELGANSNMHSEYGDDKYDIVPDSPATDKWQSTGVDDDHEVEAPYTAEAAQRVISGQYLEGASRKCLLEPPFLYITLHDYDNVLKYSRDGCLLDHKVLDHTVLDMTKVELRTMVLTESNRLYVANAATDEPQVMLFGACDHNARRDYKAIVVSEALRHGAEHAYGLTLDADGNLYVSFQHTDVVMRFDARTYEPMPLPPALQQQSESRSFYKGTFHQFGRTGEHGGSEQGIRGVLMVGRKLWVANENIRGVEVIDEQTGVVTDIIAVESPIGLAYSPAHELVFISSKKKHREGMVVAVDRHTFREVRTYRTDKMT